MMDYWKNLLPQTKQQTTERNKMDITIKNANIKGTGGEITNATITGDATIKDSGERPTHPILLPPTSDNPDVFYVLCYCPNPPPAHWEWIAFMPGEEVPEKPQPEPPPSTIPGGEKPFPPDGGWGYKEPYGWIYWPGPEGAGPK
jgi:hypothetical protein